MGLVRRAHFFHGFKKHASLLFKKTIRMARLVLTDVTPTELLTRAATNRSSRIPDQKTMALISRAAFEIEDYWRIVAILHKRSAPDTDSSEITNGGWLGQTFGEKLAQALVDLMDPAHQDLIDPTELQLMRI